MPSSKKYKLNPESLLLEIDKTPIRTRLLKAFLTVLVCLILSIIYMFVYTEVFGFELPKTLVLRAMNTNWRSRMELMDLQLDADAAILDGLAVRDDEIYRNIFGMNKIPVEVRNSGAGVVERFSYLDELSDDSSLKREVMRLDLLSGRAYVQSKSFDEVASMSKRTGELASCIPAISPLLTDDRKYRLTSSFGYRTDPITGAQKLHSGFDFACKPGNPVYATGDGVVESVSFELFGYGHSVLIDHGFGYKTRYAHMRDIYVVEGMKLMRGECIGETGNSGRSTGPHLHYEVIYRGKHVNPYNYFDLDMPKEEYAEMVKRVQETSKNVMITGRGVPRSRKRRN